MKLCKYVMYSCKYIDKTNVLSMKTAAKADAYYETNILLPIRVNTESKVDHHSFYETINRTPFCKQVSSLVISWFLPC